MDENPYGERLEKGREPFLNSSNTVIFVPEYNTRGKVDATGAFQPAANTFCRYFGLHPESCVYKIDNHMFPGYRARQLLDIMKKHVTVDVVDGSITYPQVYVFFCHGFVNGIQFGVRSPTPGKRFDRKHKTIWNEFVQTIARHSAPFVVLYSCSTGDDPDGDPDTAPGSGDDSFGDLLRDGLCRMGCWYNRVFTHTTVGHTYMNPDIKIMDGNGSPTGGHGGHMLARRKTEEYRTLARMLKFKHNNKRYGFQWRLPFMTISDIHREIVENIGSC